VLKFNTLVIANVTKKVNSSHISKCRVFCSVVLIFLINLYIIKAIFFNLLISFTLTVYLFIFIIIFLTLISVHFVWTLMVFFKKNFKPLANGATINVDFVWMLIGDFFLLLLFFKLRLLASTLWTR
jgi:hypothetical protein